MYDTHIHTQFSPDSKASLQQMAEAAVKEGLSGICITDHVELELLHPTRDEVFSVTDYALAIETVRRDFPQLDIRMGAEIGIQTHSLKSCTAFADSAPFDFILGSIHMAKERDVWELCGAYPAEEVLTMYYDDMEACVESYEAFDALAHIDYAERYFPDGTEVPPFAQFKSQITRILKVLIEKEKALEINTGGLRKRIPLHHPKVEILQLYHRLGGRLITFGSDAHRPEHVGYAAKDMIKYVKDIGFDNFTIYKERKKYPIRL